MAISVNLPHSAYKIIFKKDLLESLPNELNKGKYGCKYAIITDTKVKKLYGEKLIKILKKNKIEAELFSFTHGEKSKNFGTVERLTKKMFKSGIQRDDCIIALGGGVVGDVAGFVASIFMRGINFIQIPTTLLSMVDASVGGKTGIDNEFGKNLIGTFYQPKKVYVDSAFLKTLPKKHFQNGLSEIIKYSVIQKNSLFSILNKFDMEKDTKQKKLNKLIKISIKIKADIVEQDVREKGLRKLLNYGHTIGHAIENASNYELTHGEAIAIGMNVINQIAVQKKYLNQKIADKILNLFKKFDLPFSPPNKISVKKVLETLKFDKKNKQGKIYFVVPRKFGKMFLTNEITYKDIEKIWKKLS